MASVVKGRSKQATVLRTIRMSSTLDEALTKDATIKKIGKNALIVSILNKYVEWDSIVSNLGYLSVPSEMISNLIRGLDKNSISSIARTVSKTVASSLPFWFGSADLDSVLKYIVTSVKYTGAGLQQRIEKQGKVTRIIVYQPFDENGAAWAKAFNSGLIENVLGYPPKIVEHANSIETIIESKDAT